MSKRAVATSPLRLTTAPMATDMTCGGHAMSFHHTQYAYSDQAAELWINRYACRRR